MSMGKTQTSTQKTEYPDWYNNAQQNLVNIGQNMTAPFLQTPNYMKAGFNEDQFRGFDLARIMARDSHNYPTASILADPSSFRMNAAQVNPAEIMANINPYIDGVVNSTRATMQRDFQDKDAAIASRYAAQASLGGSGEALARGQLARGYNENLASTVAKLRMEGYNQAQALAMANAQMRQQAEAQNAQMAGSTAMINSNLLDADQRRKMNALAQLLGVGNQQQQQVQGALDIPWETLLRRKAVSPSLDRTEETKTTESPNTTGTSLLQSGIGLLGMFLSDRDEKTNIDKLGKDPKTGLTMYAYDYKSDVGKGLPKRVGPMADEIAKKIPDLVRIIGGKKVVAA